MDIDNCPFKLNIEFESGVKVNGTIYSLKRNTVYRSVSYYIMIIPKSMEWMLGSEGHIAILQA